MRYLETRDIRSTWRGEAYHILILILSLRSTQEGLRAHEGGQHAQNPFDVFQSFFGGGCQYLKFGQQPSLALIPL